MYHQGTRLCSPKDVKFVVMKPRKTLTISLHALVCGSLACMESSY